MLGMGLRKQERAKTMNDTEKQKAIAQFVFKKAVEIRQGILRIAGAPADTSGSIHVGPHANAVGDGVIVAFRGFADAGQMVIDMSWCRHLLDEVAPPQPPTQPPPSGTPTLWIGNN